jgi:putative addiction module component (TIGR02574 family)
VEVATCALPVAFYYTWPTLTATKPADTTKGHNPETRAVKPSAISHYQFKYGAAAMSPNLDALTTQALALPPEQRFELAQRLWESVGPTPELDEELIAEIERRDAEIESGATRTYSHEEVMRDAKKAIGE